MATKAKKPIPIHIRHDLALLTANGREISPDEAEAMRSIVFDGAGMYLPHEKFALLMQPPPSYAIKMRDGGEGRAYPYLKHGYVRLKLIEIFGMDWDFEILPVYSGEPYRLIPPEGNKSTDLSVMVFGRLSLRIRPLDEHGQSLISQPIVKVLSASGSAEWRKKQRFGFVVSAAESTALRRCAMPLGPAFGLTLYWDDEAMLEDHMEKQRTQVDLQREIANLPPKSIAELLSKATSRWQITATDIVAVMDVQPHQLPSLDVAATWQRLVEKYGEAK